MKPLRGVCLACALWVIGPLAMPAHAAWCNVFQVCCNSCGGTSASNYGPDPCCAPACPQPVCTTRYVQRCYYQPVTSYQTRSYYEPVTTYRTSYYYEPVTSYRYSCYYDPCTCSYQQVACPTTCYRLKSQCCPVQSWTQRCCQVPVTTYRQCSYWEPVTTCCAPPAPTCCPTSCASSAPAASDCASSPLPAAQEQRPAPAVQESTDRNKNGTSAPSYDRYYPPPQSQPLPATQGSSFRPDPQLQVPPATTPRHPTVRLDRIVALPVPSLQGQVVHSDNAPRAGAHILFVSAAPQGPQHSVTADQAGQFHVSLGSGPWLVYLTGADGRPVFDRKIEVRENEPRQVTLLSR